MQKIIIYGASGHGKVIADIVEKNKGEILGFVDDDDSKWGKLYFGYKVWGGEKYLTGLKEKEEISVIIGVGDNPARKRIKEKLDKINVHFGRAVHPSAQLGRNVTIGDGTVVMANCVVNSDTWIGNHCVVNTSASIGHDNIIGDFVHIAPGAHLGGSVKVGDLTWIGLGASLINNIIVAEHSIVGAGAVVIRDVASYSVVGGNPARLLRTNKKGG